MGGGGLNILYILIISLQFADLGCIQLHLPFFWLLICVDSRDQIINLLADFFIGPILSVATIISHSAKHSNFYLIQDSKSTSDD